jgi:DNA-binding IclR family transcriptional regulator
LKRIVKSPHAAEASAGVTRRSSNKHFEFAGDPLFNRSVEKAFAIISAFGAERRTLNPGEIAAAVGMTRSSAQRCTHTLEMVFIARFPSHKRFFIHMPIGRRLPMYCTASGGAWRLRH